MERIRGLLCQFCRYLMFALFLLGLGCSALGLVGIIYSQSSLMLIHITSSIFISLSASGLILNEMGSRKLSPNLSLNHALYIRRLIFTLGIINVPFTLGLAFFQRTWVLEDSVGDPTLGGLLFAVWLFVVGLQFALPQLAVEDFRKRLRPVTGRAQKQFV